MRRLALSAAILIGVVAAADGERSRSRISPNPGYLIGRSGGGRAGRLTSGGAAAATSFAFCDQLTAGMKVGTWSCVNGDISSPAASTLAFVGVNAPVATSGTTCAAPNYQTFVNGATDSHVKSTVASATITGDFTACTVVTPSTAGSSDNYIFLGVYETLSPFAFTQEGATLYFHGGDQQSKVMNIPVQNEKTLFCVKWNSATKTGCYYINGTAGSTEACATANSGALDGTNQILRFGSDSAGATFAGKWFGGFLTNTLVPQATLDTFFMAAVACP